MTVKELILELSNCDPESLVVFSNSDYAEEVHKYHRIEKIEQDQYYDWEKKQHVPSVRLS